MKTEIKEILNGSLKPFLMVLAIAVGIIMIFFADKDKEESDVVSQNTAVYELEKYTESLEARLSEIISEIKGAGKSQVMITFESSFEKVYANNAKVEESGAANFERTDKVSEKQIVLAGSGSNGETPILIKEMCPKVKGVAVVCEGVENNSVERQIKETVASLFGISENKICVTY